MRSYFEDYSGGTGSARILWSAAGTLLVTAFVACGEEATSTGGGTKGVHAEAGRGSAVRDGGLSDASAAGSCGSSSRGGAANASGGSEGEPGDAISAGSQSNPVGAAGSTDEGEVDAGGASTSGTNAGGASPGSGAREGSGGVGNTGNASSIPGVPCDVAATFEHRCNACHSDPPVLDAPFPLTTYAMLAEHAEAVQEVLDAGLMPPTPLATLSEEEKTSFRTWLDAAVPYVDGPCR